MALVFDKYNCKLTLLTHMLGTVPKDPEIYSSYIATKCKEKMEKMAKDGHPLASGEAVTSEMIEKVLKEETFTVEQLEELEEKGWTGFHKDEEGHFLYDYLVRGFLCEAGRTLKELENTKQLQDKFKRYVFVKPRRIRLPEIGGCLERPLRAQTPQGPRVALVRSDYIPEGTSFDVQIWVLKGGGISRTILSDVLSYGEFQGLGQWRSGGYGRFLFELSPWHEPLSKPVATVK